MKGTMLLLSAVLLLALAAPAQAGGYAALYGGYVLVPDPSLQTAAGVEIEDEGEPECASFGGKFGYWMPSLPWLAVELNIWNTWTDFTEPSLGEFNINLINFSGTLLLQHFWGPVRAYGGGGLLVTRADLDAEEGNSDLKGDSAVGAVAQAGVEYIAVCNWSLFTEYRFSYNRFKFVDIDRKFDYDRHEFLAGVGYHF